MPRILTSCTGCRIGTPNWGDPSENNRRWGRSSIERGRLEFPAVVSRRNCRWTGDAGAMNHRIDHAQGGPDQGGWFEPILPPVRREPQPFARQALSHQCWSNGPATSPSRPLPSHLVFLELCQAYRTGSVRTSKWLRQAIFQASLKSAGTPTLHASRIPARTAFRAAHR